MRAHVQGEVARWVVDNIQSALEDVIHVWTGGGEVRCGHARTSLGAGDVVCTVLVTTERFPPPEHMWHLCATLRPVVMDEVQPFASFFGHGGGSSWWVECGYDSEREGGGGERRWSAATSTPRHKNENKVKR